MTSEIIHFNEGDVEVIELSSGKWQAIRCTVDDPYEGYGSTMMEAIADLNEKLKERE